MVDLIDKHELLRALCAQVRADLETVAAAQRTTQSGATHEESRPENDKDTRALESSYLARGQAKRVLELTGEIQSLRLLEQRAFEPTMPIALSALVELTTDDVTKFWELAATGVDAASLVGDERRADLDDERPGPLEGRIHVHVQRASSRATAWQTSAQPSPVSADTLYHGRCQRRRRRMRPMRASASSTMSILLKTSQRGLR